MFRQWKLITSGRPLKELKKQTEELTLENAGLSQEIEHLTTYSVVHHQEQLAKSIAQTKQLETDIFDLHCEHEQLKEKSANADVVSRRKVLFSKLKAVSEYVADVAGLHQHDLRNQLLSQNLDTLSANDIDGPASVCMLPIDEFLTRWFNNLLMQAKMKANILLEDDFG